MSEPLYIGVDGGGTKSRARLSDAQGRVLGEGTGGPANVRLGPEPVWDSILTACREAIAGAGLGETDFGRARVGLGLAGAAQRIAVGRLLAHPHPFEAFTIETDAHIAWLGAFGGRDGAIVIVGTGSCGYGVVGGRSTYVGGWGYEISDEGSGSTLGREVLRRAVWAYDGRIRSTALSDAVLAEFGGSPEAIVDYVGRARARDYARFAPLVMEHAMQRDPLGVELITAAAAGIAQIATRLLDLGAPALSLVGGLAEPLRPWLPPPLQRVIVPPAADPLDGALMLARHAIRQKV
jgi:glucosamine kinase